MNVDKGNPNPNERLDAAWCIDSETSERVLMDRNTNKELARLPRNSRTFEDNKPSIQGDKNEGI